MFLVEDNEEFTFVGEIKRPVFRNRNGCFIEFVVNEVNNRRVRQDTLLVGLTNNQARLMSRFEEGDTFFVRAECASEEDSKEVNAINFAYLLDYKLLNRGYENSENLSRGRFPRY